MRSLLWLLPLLLLVSCKDDPPPTPEQPTKPQPEWRDSILYFVFVDRFANGDPANDAPAGPPVAPATDFQGGDWAGVIQKIEEGYFDELGVNTLWLSVPLDNTAKIHGDDVEDIWYTAYHAYWPERLDQPEEHFGTMEDFKALVDAAHARGMNVIIDFAMNHIYIDSPVYQEHPEWFWPLEQTYGGEVKKCLCGQACSWEEPTESKRCWFTEYLPDFNYTVKPARDFMIESVVSWMKETGVDGLRLDALKHVEDDFITELRARLKQEIDPNRSKPVLLIGETFSGDPELLRYYVNDRMLDGQFDFALRAYIIGSVLRRTRSFEDQVFPISMKELEEFLRKNDNFYGSNGIMSTFIGNHDLPRSIHHAEDAPRFGFEWDLGWQPAGTPRLLLPLGTSAFERMANGFTVLFTLPGIPLIYYGDEIGMPGSGDPDNRRMMDFDRSRYTPGQQLLRDRISKLASVRSAHAPLRRGQRTTLSVTDDTLAYEMKLDAESVYVLINRADTSHFVSGIPAGSYVDQLTGARVTGPQVELPPRASMILVPAS